jgi:RNase P protein component
MQVSAAAERGRPRLLLDVSEGAVQAAVQRLRRRYRAVLREQVAATLEDPDEAAIEEELRELFAALGG